MEKAETKTNKKTEKRPKYENTCRARQIRGKEEG